MQYINEFHILNQILISMLYVAATVAVAPMRDKPSHKTEMVSQLLFGELAEVIEETKDFTRVRCLYDGYEGWMQNIQLTPVDDSFVANEPIGYSYRKETSASLNQTKLYLSVATPVYNNMYFGKYQVDYMTEHVLKFDQAAFDGFIIKSIALLYQNTPYIWGGKSSFGIDCSGFTQQVFKIFDKKLLRDASLQATQGEPIGFLEEVQCGDVAFFDNEDGAITHVGILLSSEEIIHASGKVRIDKINSQGIINSTTGALTHKLRLIKRI